MKQLAFFLWSSKYCLNKIRCPTLCLFQVPQFYWATSRTSSHQNLRRIKTYWFNCTDMARQTLHIIKKLHNTVTTGPPEEEHLSPQHSRQDLLTNMALGFPIAQRLTLWSSPPVTRTLEVLLPIFRQLTLDECATNSSRFTLVKTSKSHCKITEIQNLKTG